MKSAHRYLPPYLVKQTTQTRAQWGVVNDPTKGWAFHTLQMHTNAGFGTSCVAFYRLAWLDPHLDLVSLQAGQLQYFCHMIVFVCDDMASCYPSSFWSPNAYVVSGGSPDIVWQFGYIYNRRHIQMDNIPNKSRVTYTQVCPSIIILLYVHLSFCMPDTYNTKQRVYIYICTYIIYIYTLHIWVNYRVSLNWSKADLG